MDLKKIEKLMELMKTHQLTEIELDEKGDRVRISMAGPATAAPTYYMPPAHHAPAPTVHAAASATGDKPAIAAGKAIRSPFVGTFYTAASPDSEPFVKVGQSIQPGDTLCIIEAMKLMNEIEAELSGTIRRVLVENGQPVEFDQPLFEIE